MRNALKDLPSSLDATYDRILSSISRQDRRDAVAALQLLAVSSCAISVADLAEAVVIDPESCAFDLDDRLPNHFDIVDVLSSLVTCSSRLVPMRSNKALLETRHYAGAELATEVRLAHYSVKEYITSDRILQGQVSYLHIPLYEAHRSVAKMCLTYLLQFDQREFVSQDTIRDYPFCLYAAEYWMQHAKAAYDCPEQIISSDSKLTELIVKLLDQNSPRFVNWLRLCNPCEPRQGASNKRSRENMASPLYYACYAGLLEVSRILRDQGADLNESATFPGSGERKPLNGAILGGHESVIHFLLESKADINALSEWGRTALHHASLYGDESIVQLLLHNGARLDLRTGPVVPSSKIPDPLEPDFTVYNGRTQRADISIALEEYLLEKQRHLESIPFDLPPVKDRQHWCHGHVLTTLMYNRDRGEVESATGWTALHEASWGGRVGVIDILLKYGADIDCKTRYGWTPLLFAAWTGHRTTVQALLSKGASVDVRNVYGWTPLHAASVKGHESIVRLLLNFGADIEAETSYGWTALFGAVPEGNEKTLMLLLEKGANPDAHNSHGGTALHRAARAGWEKSVRLLLQRGASCSLKSVYGTTAIEEANIHGYRHLLDVFKTVPVLDAKTAAESQRPVAIKPLQQASNSVHTMMEPSLAIKVELTFPLSQPPGGIDSVTPVPMHHE